MRFARFAPWIHAVLVGVVAGGAIVLEHGHGDVWQLAAVAAVVAIARTAGWLVGGGSSKKRRRRAAPEATVGDDVLALREDVKRLCNIAHGVNNNLSVLLGELDLLVMRISSERRTDVPV